MSWRRPRGTNGGSGISASGPRGARPAAAHEAITSHAEGRLTIPARLPSRYSIEEVADYFKIHRDTLRQFLSRHKDQLSPPVYRRVGRWAGARRLRLLTAEDVKVIEAAWLLR
jgi:hypothetical protein